jgi:hypothetical protein
MPEVMGTWRRQEPGSRSGKPRPAHWAGSRESVRLVGSHFQQRGSTPESPSPAAPVTVYPPTLSFRLGLLSEDHQLR